MTTTVTYSSTKTYTHAEGLSCAFRQWRAESHCRFLHGYALQMKVTFKAYDLDERNWVQDFGGLKDLKEWLKGTFDHKTLVAEDDPEKALYEVLFRAGVAQVVYLENVGCEAFAKLIFDHCTEKYNDGRVWVHQVEVSEHAGNSAIVEVEKDWLKKRTSKR